MKKYKILLLTLIMLTLVAPFRANAKNYSFKAKIENSNYLPGDEIKVEVILDNSFRGMLLKGFECSLSYENENLKLKKILSSEPISRNQLKTETRDHSINIKYNPKKIKEISSPESEIKLYEIYLKTYKKTPPQNINLHIEFFNCDSKEKISSNDLEINIIENPEIKNCKLKSIRPNIGCLSPDFSPDNFNYSVEVPADTKYLDFEFTPFVENLETKINRRKLNSAGKTTYFKITVSNKQLKVKRVYEIEVYRGITNKNSSKKFKSNPSSQKSKNKSKSTKEHHMAQSKNENKDEYDETYTENISSENSKNNNLYIIILITAIPLGLISYLLYEFIKYKKKINKNVSTPINKN